MHFPAANYDNPGAASGGIYLLWAAQHPPVSRAEEDTYDEARSDGPDSARDDSDRNRAYGDRHPPGKCGWGSRRSSMHALKLAVGIAWIVFWIYWLASATTSNESVRGGWRTRLTRGSAGGGFVIAGV